MKKVNYKVTPEAYKMIKTLAREMPQVPALDKHNKPVYHVHGTSEILDNKKKRVTTRPVMRYQNHEVALVFAWELFGQKGIDAYVKTVQQYVEVLNQAHEMSERLKAAKAEPKEIVD
jgi:hypothetical protein